MRYKVGVPLRIDYIALKKTIGLIDVVLRVWDEAGVEFGAPIVMTEIVAPTADVSLGLYTGVFTPDAVGQWRVRIQSATNGDDISKLFETQLTSEDDIKVQTQSIEDKVDASKLVIDATKGVVDATKLVVDATKLVVDNIKTVVDDIHNEITTGGYII